MTDTGIIQFFPLCCTVRRLIGLFCDIYFVRFFQVFSASLIWSALVSAEFTLDYFSDIYVLNLERQIDQMIW